MLQIINYFFIGVPMAIANIYSWSYLLEKKPNMTSIRFYILAVILNLITVLNYFLVNQFVKMTVITLIFMIFCYLIFKEAVNKSMILPIITQLIIVVAEIFVTLFILLCGLDQEWLSEELVGVFSGNLIMAVLTLLLIHIPIPKTVYQKLINATDKFESNQLLLMILPVIVVMNIYFMVSYSYIKMEYYLIINIALIFTYAFVMFKMASEKNKYLTIYAQYNRTKQTLSENEEMLQKAKIDNHENKNQLLTIRTMLKQDQNDSNILNYIEAMLNTKIKDDEELIKKVNVIPPGGLRSIVYAKLLTMKNNDINYNLSVDKKVKAVDLIELGDTILIDICKIVGVYLDNAIEAVASLREKNISIEFYMMNEILSISVTNNFEGVVEIEKMDQKGFTTKENGHGYGLSLAKEIIDKCHYLENEKAINKNYFTQILKIKNNI